MGNTLDNRKRGNETMIVAKWSATGTRFGADAQKCYEEIMEICDDLESASPQDILEKARDEKSELHKCFTWNDSIAAERWRVHEARIITRQLVIKEEQTPTDRPEIRLFYKTDNESGYKPTELIVQKEDEYKELLKRAYAELRAFKVKYSMLKELEQIFDLIT